MGNQKNSARWVSSTECLFVVRNKVQVHQSAQLCDFLEQYSPSLELAQLGLSSGLPGKRDREEKGALQLGIFASVMMDHGV